jgi:hypothetical protein
MTSSREWREARGLLSAPIPGNLNVHHSDTRAVASVTLCPVVQTRGTTSEVSGGSWSSWKRDFCLSGSRLRVFLYECPEWCIKIGHDRLLFTSLIYYSQLFVLCWKEMVDNNVIVTWWYCFYCCYHYWVQPGSSVIIVTKLWAVPCRFRFLAGKKYFCLPQNFQTGPGARPASCTIRTGSVPPG